jgi:hypothetical protein
MRNKACLILAPLIICVLLLASCAGHGAVGAALVRPAGGPWAAPTGGRASAPVLTVGEPLEAPTNAQLHQLLTSELKRLGKSPSDVTPHAPTGATNAAFDLAATVIDPDGPPDGGSGGGSGGILPPTGIELTWTERFIGDYSMDGQVNVQDLTPLGINWERSLAYDAATLHGGIAYWPAGDPLDDGGSVYPDPPTTTSGAANWRKARVDGKEDGVLNTQDVTPIAVHWMEQSSGYRVYAKLPGETAFHVLPNPDDATSPLTIPRSKLYPPGHTTMDSTRPVCFNFAYGDSVIALPEGRYEFYLAAYDPATDADGPASAHAVMDISGGTANQPPIAKLSLNPSFAGAPAVVTLDASLSSDPDGSIVKYQWDFDGNGTVDWSTSDPVPVSCCNGEVDTITPGDPPGPGLPPATVTVTYERTAGYASYIYPRVTVVDDKGGIAARSAKLGVTGWEIVETLSATNPDLEPSGEELLIGGDVGFEPLTGRLACAGQYWANFDGNNAHPEFAGALMYWWQVAPGDWDWEYIMTPGQLLPDDMNPEGEYEWLHLTKVRLFWDSDKQPFIIFCYDLWRGMGNSIDYRTYVAHRKEAQQWEINVLFAGTQPSSELGNRGAEPEQIIETSPGNVEILCNNKYSSWQEDKASFDFYWIQYSSENIAVEPIGWPDPEVPQQYCTGLGLNSKGETIVIIYPEEAQDHTGIWVRRRCAPSDWVTERLDHGEFVQQAGIVLYFDPCLASNGRLIIGSKAYPDAQEDDPSLFGYIDTSMPEFKCVKIAELLPGRPSRLTSTEWGISAVYDDDPDQTKTRDWHVFHTLIQPDGGLITEMPFVIKKGEDASTGLNKLFVDSNNQLYALVYIRKGDSSFGIAYQLAHRVDPRGTP